MAADVVSDLINRANDVSPRPQPKGPRPREQKVIQALIEGAPSLSAAMRAAGFKADSSAIRERLETGGDLRELLDKELKKAGISIPAALKTLASKLDAKKPMLYEGEVATMADDNDAQLRAVEQSIKLFERAGMIPGAKSESAGGSITVNVLVVK